MKPDSTLATPGEATSALADKALRRYGLWDAKPVLINVSENATYRIDGSDGAPRFALRIHRAGYHTRAGIASELAWLTALRRDGVAISPVPVPGLDGDFIQAIEDPALGGIRHVVLFEWESGREPEASGDLLPEFEVLGAISARMHRHARTWERPVGFERHVWNFETSLGGRPHWGSWRDGIGVDGAVLPLFERTVDLIRCRLGHFGEMPERFGLIHADMRLANLLVDGGEVKVLDFDDCGFSWHLYDAAAAVSFFEHEAQVPDLMAAWVRGYRSVADLPAEDEAEIPTFILLRRLLLIAWIGSHAETELARSMGAAYTLAAARMCEEYLTRFASP